MPDLDKRLDEIEKKLDVISSTPYPVFGNQMSSADDEIDLRELLNVIWAGKWILLGLSLIFFCSSFMYASFMPNVYRSEVLLSPSDESGRGELSGLASRLGGIASVAGVNLGGQARDKTALAIEVLKSRDFLIKFIKKYEMLVPLVAANGWDKDRNKLTFDSGIYNVELNEWVEKDGSDKQLAPNMSVAYQVFIDRFTVVQSKENGFVRLKFDYYSPSHASKWLESIVLDINQEIKLREVEEAKKSIEYLLGEIRRTALTDMKQIFYELIEEQYKIIMFANVRDEYVFYTVDSAFEPEYPYKPKRMFIVIVGFLVGATVGLFVVFIRSFKI